MPKFLLLRNLLVIISVDELSSCWFQLSFLHVALNLSGPGLRTTLSRARLLPLKSLTSLLVSTIIATACSQFFNFGFVWQMAGLMCLLTFMPACKRLRNCFNYVSLRMIRFHRPRNWNIVNWRKYIASSLEMRSSLQCQFLVIFINTCDVFQWSRHAYARCTTWARHFGIGRLRRCWLGYWWINQVLSRIIQVHHDSSSNFHDPLLNCVMLLSNA